MKTIELQNFLEEDFDRLISWINNEEEMIQFAGPIFLYPVTHGQLRDYIKQSIRKSFKIRHRPTGEIIGHCELNFQNQIPRLSRILIGNKLFRNKGLGKEIVRQMLDVVFTTTDFETVDLSVFDWNKNAIASYERVGFRINEGYETQMEVGGQTWKAYNMIIKKQDYLENKSV